MKRSSLRNYLHLSSLVALLTVTCAYAPAENKPSPQTSSELRITVRDASGVPVPDALVSMRVLHKGTDTGEMQVRTDESGKVAQDINSSGDVVKLQIIASGFKPFRTDYLVNNFSKDVVIRLKEQPQALTQTAKLEMPVESLGTSTMVEAAAPVAQSVPVLISAPVVEGDAPAAETISTPAAVASAPTTAVYKEAFWVAPRTRTTHGKARLSSGRAQ